MSWFLSTLICLIMQGTYFGSEQTNTIWDLSLYTPTLIADITVPVLNVNFLGSLWKILSWDYTFYTGQYEILRYFWLVTLTPGAVWGIAQAFMWVCGSLISLFRIL